jgi:phage-related tail protein
MFSFQAAKVEFLSVKEQLEEYIDGLQRQLDEARSEIQLKDTAIERLRVESQLTREEITEWFSKKQALEMQKVRTELREKVRALYEATKFISQGESSEERES